MLSNCIILLFSILPYVTSAQVAGSPFGFASDVIGGGSVTPAAPSSIAELKSWLSDDVTRVILINKEWDFTGSEGTVTTNCCRDSATGVCSGGTSAGQDTITATCTSGKWVSCTYDKAGTSGMPVGSNKSIVGVGSSGVLKGKGLVVQSGASNVIIQNIHITELNPKYVWGGDAILLDGCDKVWIDHNKFSLIGRQMIVTGFNPAGHITISNNEFDGVTPYSSSCNGQHYWTMLLYGAQDWYTLQGNYIHHCSGRAPHMGYSSSIIRMQAVNNLWENGGGHAFDIDVNTYVLIEGNVFNNVSQPITPGSSTAGGHIFDTPDGSSESTCNGCIGKGCTQNSLADSGTWTALTDTAVLATMASSSAYLISPTPVSAVSSSVVANAGTGKIA